MKPYRLLLIAILIASAVSLSPPAFAADAVHPSHSVGSSEGMFSLRVTPGARDAGSTRFEGGIGEALSISGRPLDFLMQQRTDEDNPRRRSAGESDPVLGAARSFQWPASPAIAPGRWGSAAKRPIWHLLPELARAYDVQFIADAYWNRSIAHYLEAPSSATEKSSLFRLLDRTAWFTHRWDRRDRLVRLRSRTWFLDRPSEIPLRLVRRWRELIEQHGELPLDEYVQNVGSLTDSQLANLHYPVSEAGLPDDFGLVYQARHALRLYAALSPAQRQALWKGTTLPVTQMTPPQQALFSDAAKEMSRIQSRPVDPEQWTAGTLKLIHSPTSRARERKPDSPPFSGARHQEAAAPSRTDAAPISPAPEPASSDRYRLTRIMFYFDYGSELRNDVDLVVASSP